MFSSSERIAPDSWSPDEKWLLYEVETKKDDWDIGILPLTPTPGGKTIPLVAGEFRQEYSRFSPDQRWVAYQSTESGQPEIFVTPFVPPGDDANRGAKVQVSASGGLYPRWSRDGRTLYFVAPEGRMMAASVKSNGTAFTVDAVRPLFTFRLQDVDYPYDVTPDGERVIVANGLDAAGSESVQVIVNWTPTAR